MILIVVFYFGVQMLNIRYNSKNRFRFVFFLFIALLLQFSISEVCLADEEESVVDIHSVVEVQKYNRSIHIMAMLLAGFGFLMVFVRGYGRSALTATFLMVSISIPMYILITDLGIFSHVQADIDRLILAEFASAGLLIAAGAALGRIKLYQYLLFGLCFIPFYMLNEWILLDGGLGLLASGSVVDTGGSLVIHAFGALFGLGVVISLTKAKDREVPIGVDAASERFSLLGSMVLWIFWPSFCAAIVPTSQIPQTVLNVVLALCGSTLATYVVSVKLRGKVSAADIANASLAGGVAIGSTCVVASTSIAFIIGILAGVLSTVGFAVIQDKLQNKLNMLDTCGVTNLHGFPGIMGGLAAIFVVNGISVSSQIIGIIITIIIGIFAGIITGTIVKIVGKRDKFYEDSEEFTDVE